MHTVLTAIVFLPLLGALIAGLFGTKVFKGLGRDADVYGEGPVDDPHDHTEQVDHDVSGTTRHLPTRGLWAHRYK